MRDAPGPPRAALKTVVLVVLMSLLGGSCGPSRPNDPDPPPSPPGQVGSLLTGLGAIELAASDVEGAAGLYRIALAFPRPRGTAEFWSVALATADGPRKVDIEVNRVVGSGAETIEPEGAGAFPLDRLAFDSDEALTKVEELIATRGDPGLSAALSPLALDILRSDAPRGHQGEPLWQFLVTNDQGALVDTMWVSAESGQVVG